MTKNLINTTATLATAFGIYLITASNLAQESGAVDAKAVRELAVFSRVLEKRLGELRRAIALPVSFGNQDGSTPPS